MKDDGRKTLVRLLHTARSRDGLIESMDAIRRLRVALDALELEAIRTARERGATWEDIAEAVGVTRQALHQRVGRRLDGQDPGKGKGKGKG